jgi:hypothetical protein
MRTKPICSPTTGTTWFQYNPYTLVVYDEGVGGHSIGGVKKMG